jgi:hypothetical protein
MRFLALSKTPWRITAPFFPVPFTFPLTFANFIFVKLSSPRGANMPSKPRPKTPKAPNAPNARPSELYHPIRIVPLHPGKAKAAAPQVAPKLTYRNGPLLTSVQVFTVFWGSDWNTAPQDALLPKLNQFFDFILASQLLDQLAEYSVPNQKIVRGLLIGTLTVTSPAPGKTVDDSAIQSFLQQQITSGALPATTPNSLYFVYLPPGVTVTQGGSASCQVFCGYHDAINNNIFYAVMPYPGCAGCLGGIAAFDALTSTSSHELCEAITDPIPGQGWYDDNNGEIGDICAWQTRTLGGYTIQLEWSNAANRCI